MIALVALFSMNRFIHLLASTFRYVFVEVAGIIRIFIWIFIGAGVVVVRIRHTDDFFLALEAIIRKYSIGVCARSIVIALILSFHPTAAVISGATAIPIQLILTFASSA